MKRDDFIHSSARLRVLEKKLLKNDIFARLVDAKDLEGAYYILSDTIYSKHINSMKNRNEFEYILESEMKQTTDLLSDMTPNSNLINLLSTGEFYHDVKMLVKEYASSKDLSAYYYNPENEKIEAWRDILSRGEKDELKELPKYILEAINKFRGTKDPQDIDFEIDKIYFKNLLEMSESLNEKMFTDYVKHKIDFANVDILLRAKVQETEFARVSNMFIPGGYVDIDTLKNMFLLEIEEQLMYLRKTELSFVADKVIEAYNRNKNISDVEKVFDNELLVSVKEGASVTYGPEVLFSYLAFKEREIQNLRIILTSKRSGGVSSESIRGRLREIIV